VASGAKLGLRERFGGGYALVSGAAGGIGRAFATYLAEDGFDVLLVDREADECRRLAETLRTEHGVDAQALICDLSEPGLEENAERWSEQYDIGLLVNNAGISPLDPFLDIPLETHLATLDVNCRATLVLTHVIGRAMASRGKGGIIIVSSASALSGSPYFCHYAATKGYGLNLACGLWSELRETGVEVLAVCPGMTDTKPVQDRGLDQDLPFYVPITGPGPVALQSLRALGKQPTLVPTLADRLSAGLMSKLMPRGWALSIIKRSIERLRE
jgi:short-subunit dehydrogenase